MNEAVVYDRRRGYVYVATAVDCGQQAVTFTGRLRERDINSERLYEQRTRTLPLCDVEILWLADVPAVEASTPVARLRTVA